MKDELEAFSEEVNRLLKENDDRIQAVILEAAKERCWEIKVDSPLYFSLRSGLVCAQSKYTYFNDEFDTWNNRKRSHESWKAEALNDPLLSDHIKKIIREGTKQKKVYKTNELTMELAKCLKVQENNLIDKLKITRHDAVLFLVDIAERFLGNFPSSIDAFEKAMKKAKTKISPDRTLSQERARSKKRKRNK
ncbi:MAG: hypothetical protein KF846_07980 [Cyclobacteriaceae bacterium]|nr:hypothetical protein [Cyclobacteriaceae bacterium]